MSHVRHEASYRCEHDLHGRPACAIDEPSRPVKIMRQMGSAPQDNNTQCLNGRAEAMHQIIMRKEQRTGAWEMCCGALFGLGCNTI